MKSIWEFIRRIFSPQPPPSWIPPVVSEPVKVPEAKPVGKRYLDKNGKLLVTQDGMDLITHFEGYYEKAYVDPVGIVTIGWGTIVYPNGKKVKIGDTATREQNLEYLMNDIWEDAAKYVRAFTSDPIEEKLTDYQFSALTSLVYNRGAGRYREFIAPHLNKSDMTATVKAIKSLNWAISNGSRKYLLGLDRRRWAEAYMFLGRDWHEFDNIAKFQAFKNRGYKA